MPSSTDVLSAGVRNSLAGVFRKNGETSSESNSVDSALASANKLADVTKHTVEYGAADCQRSSTQNVLKSKYVVLDAKHPAGGAHISGIKSLNGTSVNGTKDSGCSNGSLLNGLNKLPFNGSTNGSQVNGVKSVHHNGNVNGITKNASSIAANISNGIKRPGTNGFPKNSSNGNGGENGASKSPAISDSTLPEPKHILYDPEKVTLGWKTNFPAGAGMVNLGNTCYLNATLQALFHVPAFVEWLLSDTDHLKKCAETNGQCYGDCITCSMARTLRASHSNVIVKPHLITNKLKMICRNMGYGSQEDAHEFMRHLLENMEKGYVARCKAQKLDAYSKETTPINQIFGGYIRTEVKCLKCNYASTTFQHFQDLILDIRKASKVEEAIDQYFSKEKLDGDNSYKCEKCKCMVPATKKFSIERPPKVLCIQLKRFSPSGLKNPKPVEHRLNMDLRRHVHPQSTFSKNASLPYRLISMVTHVGPTSGCGHYTAIAQCASKTFHQFDDTNVRSVSVQTVLNNCAYILVYEMEPHFSKQGSKPAAASSIAPISSLGNSNHNIMNGVSKNAGHMVGGLPSAKDRDRVAFGLTTPKPPSAPPRLVIHSKKADASSLVPTLKAPNVQNGYVNKEARASNFIGPVQVVINGKHSGSPAVKDRPSVPGTSKLPDSASPHEIDSTRKDLSQTNKEIVTEKKHTGSLVPYDYDDDSSSRESSLSPPLNDEQEVLTVKATTPSNWQVTNSSGQRSPSIHSESSNHSVASATGSNWNVTEKQPETQSMGSKTVTIQKVKDRKAIETSSQKIKYSSDPELSNSVKSKRQLRAQSIERSFNLPEDCSYYLNTLAVMNARVRRSSVSSESDSSSSEQSKKKLKVFNKTGHGRNSIVQDNGIKRQEPSSSSSGSRFSRTDVSTSRNADNPSSSAQRNTPSSSLWNGDRNTNTVNDLLKMSHQGFGDRVASWNGDQSQVERSLDEDRQASRKRPRDEYEMELDRGRTKKVKKDHHHRWRQFPVPYGCTPYNEYKIYRHNSQYSRNHHKNHSNNRHKRWGPESNDRYKDYR